MKGHNIVVWVFRFLSFKFGYVRGNLGGHYSPRRVMGDGFVYKLAKVGQV